MVSCVLEIGEPLSRHATTHRKTCNRWPLVIADCAENVCPLIVADVTREDEAGSVAIDNANDANSARIAALACASNLTAE